MWTSEVNNKFLLTPQTAIIKNIVYEIIRECDKRDFVCEKKFVTFMMHLLSLQFKEEVDFSERFDRKSIEELITMCLNHIIGKRSLNFHHVLVRSQNCSFLSPRFKRDAHEYNFEDASFLH